MQTICAWCDKLLEIDGKDDGQKRFIVCDTCRADLFKNIRTSIIGPYRPLPRVKL